MKIKKIFLLFSFINICFAKENLKLGYRYDNGHKLIADYKGKYISANTKYELSIHSDNEKNVFGGVNASYINKTIKLGAFVDYKHINSSFHFETGIYSNLNLKNELYLPETKYYPAVKKSQVSKEQKNDIPISLQIPRTTRSASDEDKEIEKKVEHVLKIGGVKALKELLEKGQLPNLILTYSDEEVSFDFDDKQVKLDLLDLLSLYLQLSNEKVKQAVFTKFKEATKPFTKFLNKKNYDIYNSWKILSSKRNEEIIQTSKFNLEYVIPIYTKFLYNQKIGYVNLGFDTELDIMAAKVSFKHEQEIKVYENYKKEKLKEIKHKIPFNAHATVSNIKYNIKPYVTYDINDWHLLGSVDVNYTLSNQDIVVDDIADNFFLNKVKFMIKKIKFGLEKGNGIKGTTHEVLISPKFNVSYTHDIGKFKFIPQLTLSLNYYKFIQDWKMTLFTQDVNDSEKKKGYVKSVDPINKESKLNETYIDYTVKPEFTIKYEVDNNVSIFVNGGSSISLKPVKFDDKLSYKLSINGLGSVGFNFNW